MSLIVVRENWSQRAAEWLRPACDDLYTVDDLALDVRRNQCMLFNLYFGDKFDHVGSFALRVDDDEMVVVAAGGNLPGVSLYAAVTPFIKRLAKNCGAKYVRGHTRKSGIGRKMEMVGFVLSELVYRMEVN